MDSRDRKQEIHVVPLLTCSKDISKYMSVLSFTGPEDKVDLILCQSGIFTKSEKVNSMTTAPCQAWSRLGKRGKYKM